MQEIPLAVPSPLQEEKQFLETEVFSTISMRKFFWSSQGQPINQELLATQLKLLSLVIFPHGSGGQEKKYKENMKTLCFTRVKERERKKKKNLAKCLGKRRTNTETIKSVGLSHLRP